MPDDPSGGVLPHTPRLYRATYMEVFFEPEAAWLDDDDPAQPVDFTFTDLLWYRPIDPQYLKKRPYSGLLANTMYSMTCARCDTKWHSDPSDTPKCWYCGRFVPLNQNFKDERKAIRYRKQKEAKARAAATE